MVGKKLFPTYCLHQGLLPCTVHGSLLKETAYKAADVCACSGQKSLAFSKGVSFSCCDIGLLGASGGANSSLTPSSIRLGKSPCGRVSGRHFVV